MKKGPTFGKIFFFIVTAWLLIGLVYAAGDYIPKYLAGERPVFHPLIGVPLLMVGWPWNMYADLIHGFYDLPFFLTLGAVLIALILFLFMLFHRPKRVS
ncbi:MAG: hypothetical protein ACOYKC_03520 [Anaerolineaceae bacterium]|jgi:hypothetical protein